MPKVRPKIVSRRAILEERATVLWPNWRECKNRKASKALTLATGLSPDDPKELHKLAFRRSTSGLKQLIKTAQKRKDIADKLHHVLVSKPENPGDFLSKLDRLLLDYWLTKS